MGLDTHEDFPSRSLAELLRPWLASIGLDPYLEMVADWCNQEGAAFIEEVQECWEQIADDLGFTPPEKERFEMACVTRTFGSGDARYVLLEQLGHGATATVRRCTREGQQWQFATKIIDLQLVRKHPNHERQMEILNRETCLLRTLSHKNIVRLHDVVETPATLYLVLDLVRGANLFEHITTRPGKRLDEAEARHVFAQVLGALEYIHSRNIVHRDLKPDNILLDLAASAPGRPGVKVSDFGHSKLIRDGYNRAETAVGTPFYWAPEVTDPYLATYDERADLWSLGVVLHVMLVGAYPFTSEGSRAERFSFHGSRQTEELVRGLIRVRPEDRMSLRQCSECSWMAASDAAPPAKAGGGGGGRRQREIRVRVPRKPARLSALNAELQGYSRGNRVAARLQLLEVVVTFDPRTSCEVALRRQLMELLASHFHDLRVPPRAQECDEESARARSTELQDLVSTYGPELVEVIGEMEWRIRIRRDNALRVILAPTYPKSQPPAPVVECSSDLLPWFTEEELLNLWAPGQTCVYEWVERVRDALVPEKFAAAPARKKSGKPSARTQP